MHDFSSVHFLGGREIESRRQLCEREKRERGRKKRRKFGNEKRKRLDPKLEVRKRESIRRM